MPPSSCACRGCCCAASTCPPLLTEAKRQLHAEADYLAEAQHLARFGALPDESDMFALPVLHAELCTQKVLAMSIMESAPLDSLVDAPRGSA